MSAEDTSPISSRSTVRAASISITQALGIREGEGFVLKDLAPGLNVICAPNATGKTTLGRTLMCLAFSGDRSAWNSLLGGTAGADEAFRRLVCSGDFRIDPPASEASPMLWRVEILGGGVSETIDGKPGGVPARDATLCAKYSLALPDLLVDSGEDFGRRISEQVSGGVRWSALRSELGWERLPSAAKRLSKDVLAAKLELERRQGDQESIARAQDSISELKEEWTSLEKRLAQVPGLDAVQAFLAAQEHEATCKTELESVSPLVALLEPRDFEDAKQLDQECSRRSKDLDDVLVELAAHAVDAPPPPSDAERSADEVAIRTRVTELRSLENEVRAAGSELSRVQRQREAAQTQLVGLGAAAAGSGVTLAPNPDSITAAGSAVSEAARAVEAVQHATTEFDRLASRLRETRHLASSISPRREDVLAAMQIAGRWLRPSVRSDSAEAAPKLPGWILPALLTMALLAVGFAVGASLGWPALGWASAILGLCVVGGGAFVVSRIAATSAPASVADDRDRTEYEALVKRCRGLPPMASWTVDGVVDGQTQLAELLASALWQEVLRDIDRVAQDLANDLKSKQDFLGTAEAEFANLVGPRNARHGRVWDGTVATLLSAWLSLVREEAGLRAKLEWAESLRDASRDRLVRLLASAGLPRCESQEVLTAEFAENWIKDLISRRKAYNEDQLRLSKIQARERVQRDALEDARRNEASLYERLPDGIDRYEDLLRRQAEFERFLKLKQGFSEATRAREASERLVERWPGLRQWDAAAIGSEQSVIPSLRDRLSAVNSEISRIESDIEKAGGGDAVRDAEADFVARNEAFRATEIEDVETAVGITVFEWARREAAASRSPRVLARAREYVARFTAGRLQFSVEDGSDGEPALIARSGSDSWRSVDQLSSGERVQLLLAIRLAFLDESESVRLPLVLDEVLATADDLRSASVMDAVIEIVREGRQVIYMTSQRDEVERWRSRAALGLVPLKEFDLESIRDSSTAGSVPLRRPRVGPPELPPPRGLSREEYATRISVTAINWRDDGLASLHLWYVLEDMDLLHRLLSGGVCSVGQLESLGESTRNQDVLRALEASQIRIRGFQQAALSWGVGLGAPVPSRVLTECDAISEKFRDDARSCLEKHRDNAREFLKAVEDIPRFRGANVQKLEDWLRSEGCIDERVPLSMNEIEDSIRRALLDAGCVVERCGAEVREIVGYLPDGRGP